jgi:hypothetical protein
VPFKQINKEDDEGRRKEGSFVIVYVHKDSPLRATVTSSDGKQIYSRHFDIRCPSENNTYESDNK